MLFVSSTTGGGSGRSQRELARLLVERGHDVVFLVDDKRPAPVRRWWYEQLSDLAVRLEQVPGRAAVGRLERLPGRRPTETTIDGLPHFVTPVPQNAFDRVVQRFRPDLVVGNSVVRLTWRRLRARCDELDLPTLLYVREVATFGHFERMADAADVVIANADSLATRVRAEGYDCPVIPSVVDVRRTEVVPDRTAALLVNPIPSHGIDLFWEIAKSMPSHRFVVQESWPLDRAAAHRIERAAAECGNVEFRRRADPSPELYRRARVLLVPHRLDNRPRVIVEAQWNGIPAVVSDHRGLVEAVGNGGVVVDEDDLQGWCSAIRRMWDRSAEYDELCRLAWTHARRAEIDPALVVGRFEAAAGDAIEVRATASSPRQT